MSRLRVIPTNKFRSCKRRGMGRRQGGQMQRLANVARSVAASVLVLVEERAARGKVEERDTGQQGHSAAGRYSSQEALHQLHATSKCTLHLAILDVRIPNRLLGFDYSA
jgi:uncharacterized protein YcaQ